MSSESRRRRASRRTSSSRRRSSSTRRCASSTGSRTPATSWPQLRELEDKGDQLERDAVAELFATTDDAKTIIRWKDIHERLEEAVDALENAADVLEAIVVKNR